MRPRPDAAENASRPPAAASRPPGFNEAAARCRGKPGQEGTGGGDPVLASMRPRPDAAENGRGGAPAVAEAETCFNEAAARCRGKQSRLEMGAAIEFLLQ